MAPNLQYTEDMKVSYQGEEYTADKPFRSAEGRSAVRARLS
jgi:hypothetical protein